MRRPSPFWYRWRGAVSACSVCGCWVMPRERRNAAQDVFLQLYIRRSDFGRARTLFSFLWRMALDAVTTSCAGGAQAGARETGPGAHAGCARPRSTLKAVMCAEEGACWFAGRVVGLPEGIIERSWYYATIRDEVPGDRGNPGGTGRNSLFENGGRPASAAGSGTFDVAGAWRWKEPTRSARSELPTSSRRMGHAAHEVRMRISFGAGFESSAGHPEFVEQALHSPPNNRPIGAGRRGGSAAGWVRGLTGRPSGQVLGPVDRPAILGRNGCRSLPGGRFASRALVGGGDSEAVGTAMAEWESTVFVEIRAD